MQNTAVIDTVTGQNSTKVTNPLVNGSVNVAVSDGVGGWYIGGSFTSVNGITRNRIARINSDGSVHEFNPDCSGQVTALAVSSDAKYVYFSGNFNSVGGVPWSRIAKVSAISGKLVTEWNPTINNFAEVLKISGNYLYIGGRFSTVNGTSAQCLVRVNQSDGLLDGTWLPNPDNYVLCLDINSSTLYAGGSFGNIGGEERSNAAEIRLSDGTATTWNPSPDGTVFDILFDPDFDRYGVYLGGTFSKVNSVAHNRICRVSTSTGDPDASWVTLGDSSSKVMCLETFAGGLYIGGKFTSVNGQVQSNASSVLKSGAMDVLWKSGFDGSDGVESIAFNSDGSAMLVCGSISSSMSPRSNAAAYNLSTGKLTDWDPKTNGMVKAIAIGNNAAYIGGSFTKVGGASNERLAKTNLKSGTVEQDGGAYWSANGDVNALLIDPSGSYIYAGGLFTEIKGSASLRIGGYKLNDGSQFSFASGLTLSNTA
ncbi:MAG TPA: delta-60 repeat domain-containing protein, partial [Spirochaetota bacterium]|nr:delta-60 repeat domain-containing protein [Spirochaetota bacterium]